MKKKIQNDENRERKFLSVFFYFLSTKTFVTFSLFVFFSLFLFTLFSFFQYFTLYLYLFTSLTRITKLKISAAVKINCTILSKSFLFDLLPHLPLPFPLSLVHLLSFTLPISSFFSFASSPPPPLFPSLTFPLSFTYSFLCSSFVLSSFSSSQFFTRLLF